MFFAIELQPSGERSRICRASSSRPRVGSYVVARLLCAASIRNRSSSVQRRRRRDNSASLTDNASSWCFASDKPRPSTVIALAEIRLRPPHVRLPARPPKRAPTTPWYSCSHRPHVYRFHPWDATLDRDLRLPRQARHVRESRPPRHAHPRTRPRSYPGGLPPGRCSTSGPPCPPRTPRLRSEPPQYLLGSLLGPQQFRYRSSDELGHGLDHCEMGCLGSCSG